MHKLYAYAGMRIYLTMRLTAKASTEINYESKGEINHYKTGNYTASEKSN